MAGIGVWLLVVVVALLLGLVVGLVGATDPQRMVRAYRDPRLVARVDARARELVARGWVRVAGGADEPSTIRRLRRAAPGCEEVALAIGCTPRGDWCRLEIVADIGVDDDVAVGSALKGDRDGPIEVKPHVAQRRGAGFVVTPAEALARLPARLVEELAVWPQAWHLTIVGRTITVRADVRGVGAIEGILEDVLARLVAPRLH